MKKGIILYKTKYGSTKKYADWLDKETKFDCITIKQANKNLVKDYDTIILAAPVYASTISGLSFLKKIEKELKNKKVALFCVGISLDDKETLEQIKSQNLKNNLKEIPCFYGLGAWDLNKMSRKDRMLCKLLQKYIVKQDPKTYEPWQKALAKTIGKTVDWTDKKYLTPLLDWLK